MKYSWFFIRYMLGSRCHANLMTAKTKNHAVMELVDRHKRANITKVTWIPDELVSSWFGKSF